MTHKIFISFSSKDKKIAETIYDRFEKKGLKSWICSKDIPPGADYQSCITDAMRSAELVILVFSSNANSSAEIAKELSLASKKTLIPVRIEDVLPEGSFEYQLANRQFIDLFDDFDTRLDELAINVKNVLEGKSLKVQPKDDLSKLKKSKKIKKIILYNLLGILFLCILSILVWFYIQHNSTVPSTRDVPVDKKSAPQNEQTPVAKNESKIINPSQPIDKIASEDVSSIASALSGLENIQRLNSLESLKNKLPNEINVSDAELILNKMGGFRVNAVALIAKNLKSDLNGEDVKIILGNTENVQRLNALKSIVSEGKVKKDLLVNDVTLMIDNTGSFRTNAVDLIVKNLKSDLNGEDVKIILGNTENVQRLYALESIVSEGKVKRGLKLSDLDGVLQNMGSFKPNAIAVLTK